MSTSSSGGPSSTGKVYRRCARGQRHRWLSLESLEARHLLAQMIWDGEAGAADTSWSNPKNWAGDVAPQVEDNLFFPASTQHVSTNDYAAGTRFRSITISEAGYVIGGNAVTLTDGIAYNAPANTGGSALNAPVTL